MSELGRAQVYKAEMDTIVRKSGVAGMVSHMRAHLDLALINVCLENGFSISALNPEQQQLVLDQVTTNPENREWINNIFVLADQVCAAGITVDEELRAERDKGLHRFMDTANQAILCLVKPNKPPTQIQMNGIQVAYNHMQETSLDLAFHKRLTQIGCCIEDEEAIKDLISLELQSLRFVTVLRE